MYTNYMNDCLSASILAKKKPHDEVVEGLLCVHTIRRPLEEGCVCRRGGGCVVHYFFLVAVIIIAFFSFS